MSGLSFIKHLLGVRDPLANLPSLEEGERAAREAGMPWLRKSSRGAYSELPETQGGFGRERSSLTDMPERQHIRVKMTVSP